jgi:hypothetical protein
LSYSLVECSTRRPKNKDEEDQCGICGVEFMNEETTGEDKEIKTDVNLNIKKVVAEKMTAKVINRDRSAESKNAEEKAANQDNEGYETVLSKNAKKNKKKNDRKLMILREVENGALRNINKESEWEEIELAVDSGATETVMGEDMLECVDVKEGRASKAGVEYEVANGDKIPNLGEKKFVGHSEEGVMRGITAQVCDVNKALLSVKRMMTAGNRVVFDEDGSFIEDKATKEKMWLKEDKGLFVVKLWVKKGF